MIDHTLTRIEGEALVNGWGKVDMEYKERFLIDMSEMQGLQQLGKPSLYSIAQSLESINKVLGHMTTGFNKLQIDIFTTKDREKEYQEHLESLNEFKKEQKNS